MGLAEQRVQFLFLCQCVHVPISFLGAADKSREVKLQTEEGTVVICVCCTLRTCRGGEAQCQTLLWD